VVNINLNNLAVERQRSLFEFLINNAVEKAQNPDAAETNIVFDPQLGDETSRGVIFDHVGDILNAYATGKFIG